MNGGGQRGTSSSLEPGRNDFDQAPIIEVWFDTKGGVYSGVSPHLLDQNQCAYAKNADWDEFGTRMRRTGVVPFGTPGVSPAGVGSWAQYSTGYRKLVGVWGERSYWSSGDRVWSHMPDTNTTAWSLPSPGLYHIEQGYATLDGTSEGALFFASIIPWTNATYADLGIVPETYGNATIQSSYQPRAIRWWQGRLWLGTERDNLRWSNILDGATIDASNSVRVGPYDGDDITAIVPTRAETNRLYIFKEDHIYGLDVVWSGGVQIPSTENTLDTTNSNLITISERVGCVAPKTIVYASGSKNADIFFLARDGYRSLIRVEQDKAGGAGQPISEPIKDIMERVNWPEAVKAHAAIADHKIYLALPLDSNTECSTTVVYDLIHKRWIGEYSWAPKDSTQFNLEDRQYNLYLQWRESTGETYASTAYTGYTTGAHLFEALTREETAYRLLYLDPGGVAVDYEEQSRAFTFGDYGKTKQWNWLDMIFGTVATTATYTLSIKVDNRAWSTITVGTVVPTSGENSFEVKQFGLTTWPVGQRLQLKFNCDGEIALNPQAMRVSAWPFAEEWF